MLYRILAIFVITTLLSNCGDDNHGRRESEQKLKSIQRELNSARTQLRATSEEAENATTLLNTKKSLVTELEIELKRVSFDHQKERSDHQSTTKLLEKERSDHQKERSDHQKERSDHQSTTKLLEKERSDHHKERSDHQSTTKLLEKERSDHHKVLTTLEQARTNHQQALAAFTANEQNFAFLEQQHDNFVQEIQKALRLSKNTPETTLIAAITSLYSLSARVSKVSKHYKEIQEQLKLPKLEKHDLLGQLFNLFNKAKGLFGLTVEDPNQVRLLDILFDMVILNRELATKVAFLEAASNPDTKEVSGLQSEVSALREGIAALWMINNVLTKSFQGDAPAEENAELKKEENNSHDGNPTAASGQPQTDGKESYPLDPGPGF